MEKIKIPTAASCGVFLILTGNYRSLLRGTTKFQKFCVPEMQCISVYYTQLRNKEQISSLQKVLYSEKTVEKPCTKTSSKQ